jgi:hypothetical protein
MGLSNDGPFFRSTNAPQCEMHVGNLEDRLLTESPLQNHLKKKKPRRLLPGSGLPSFDFSLNPRDIVPAG